MRYVRRTLVAAIFVAAALVCTTRSANAHAISIGFENAGPGAVTIWLGTYQHGGHHLEGSMQLQGALGTVFGPVVQAFTVLTGTGVAFMPAGLIDGVTNFYAPASTGALVGTEGPFNTTGCALCGPLNHWQGATFSGLGPGDYQFNYIPIAVPTAEWAIFNPNMNGIFNLTGVITPPTNQVPEPATLTLFGLGLLGLAGLGRKRHGIKR